MVETKSRGKITTRKAISATGTIDVPILGKGAEIFDLTF
jgi:hypothetical protein